MTTEPTTVRLIVPALGPLYARLAGLSYPMIRFFTGLILVPHGAQKLFGWFGGGGLEGTGQFFSANLGLEPGLLFALLVGATEFFGGLFLAVGFLTRPASPPLGYHTAYKFLVSNTFPLPTGPASWYTSGRERRAETQLAFPP